MKDSCCFLEQETLSLMFSTGWFQIDIYIKSTLSLNIVKRLNESLKMYKFKTDFHTVSFLVT